MKYLERDASYWTTSLLHKVKNLEKELDKRMTTEERTHEKAKSLEDKLDEVSNASTFAAQSFKELRKN